MQAKVKTLEPTKVLISIDVETPDLLKAKQAAIAKLAVAVTVTGYRRGKAPFSAVEKVLDPNVLSEETLQLALSEAYSEALIKNQLRPVSNPEINVKSYVPNQTLTFEATLEVIGKVQLAKYSGLKVPRTQAKVSEAEVNTVLKRLQKQLAKRSSVKSAAKIGDEVLIDFSGKYADNDELIDGASGKDYPLELGSESFIPGFETKLVGIKAGESKEISLTFPKDYQAEFLRNKKAIFEVKAKSVNALVLPELNDSFAKQVGQFKTLAELKADIKRELLSGKESDLELQYQNQLLEQIANTSKVDIPKSLIADEAQRIERDARQNAAYRSQTWEEYLKDQGQTEADFSSFIHTQAEQRVKAGLVLGEIATLEKISIESKEVDERVAALKLQYANDQAMQKELDKEQNKTDLRNRIMVEKTIQRLIQLNS